MGGDWYAPASTPEKVFRSTPRVGDDDTLRQGVRDRRHPTAADDLALDLDDVLGALRERLALGELLAADQGVDVNTPQQASGGAKASDGLLDSIGALFGSGGSSGNGGGSSAKGGETVGSDRTSASPGSANGAEAKASDETLKPVVNEGYQTYTIDYASKTADGRTTSTMGSISIDNALGRDDVRGFHGSTVTVGLITIGNGRRMPGDESTGPVQASAGLAINNPYDNRGNGGGADNNRDQAAGGLGQIDPRSDVQHIGDGDGAGTDGSDNGVNHRLEGLASGSSFARRDQGDGGNADNRGGNSASPKDGAVIRKPIGAGQRQVQVITQ